MLRADRNAGILAGLICAGREVKGLGYVMPLQGVGGKPLTAADFDPYNHHEPQAPKEPTVDDFMRVLGRKG